MRYQEFIVLSLLVVMSISIPVTTSTTIVQITNTHVLAQTEIPSARFLPGMIYDPVNERVMMFGGGYGDDLYGDTWIFDYETKTWTELALSTSPMSRHSHVMVFDSTNEVIVLFGGYNGTSPSSDTWVFNCASEIWTEVTPEMSPPDRMSQAMVYDSVNEKVLLFSGYGPDGPFVDDTWAYDYATNTWEEMSPAVSPHARYGAAYAFDEVNESMIIFGGNSNGYFSDTWSYQYLVDTWIELAPTTHPQPLKWSSMTYDPTNQKSILFGGDIGYPLVSNETWIYDSTSNEWVEREPVNTPSGREAFGFTFDSVNEKAILYGGSLGTGNTADLFNETWTYDYLTNTWIEIGQVIDDDLIELDPFLLLSTITLGVVVLVIVFVYLKKR